MTRTKLSIALMILFAPAIALAHGGGGGGNGGGHGNGGVGGGMGNGAGIGAGSMNGIGHGVGGAANGNAGMNANVPERDVDSAPDTGSARGLIAQAREDARERAAARAARMAATGNASANTHPDNHGGAVSAEAHLARSQHDGGIGKDVSAVARDKSTLKTHTKSHTRIARTDTSTRTHPVNHGAAVSAEAHLARTQHDGGIGKDVSAVARDKSTLKTHTKMHTRLVSTDTSTRTHPVNHGAAVSAEAHLARTQHDGGIGQDVSAVARDKSTLKTHTTMQTRVARADTSTRTHPVNHGAAVSAEAHLARTQHDGGIGKDVSAVARDKSTLKTHAKDDPSTTTDK